MMQETGTFRKILPQLVASTIKNFLIFDLGLALGFPTIVIASLSGNTQNRPELLSFSNEQASWFASIGFFCQPVGSIISGYITEKLGRKRSMILVNIPHIVAWLMLYFASTLEEMYIAGALLGLGIGFMEAPVITYIGEISQPSIRDILTCCASVFGNSGIVACYFLGTFFEWRQVALISCFVPVLTFVLLFFVPETPMWLLSKHRDDEALKSLQWLRGWVHPNAVRPEFTEIKSYSEESSKCSQCCKDELKCNHPQPKLLERIKELGRKRIIKPFILIVTLYVFGQFCGASVMRPYLVQIFQAYEVPIDPQQGAVVFGLIATVANILMMMIVKFVGKRRILLFSMIGTAFSTIALGLYAFYKLPRSKSSFNNFEASNSGQNMLPLLLIYGICFFANIGILHVPWMMLSEVYAFKCRGLASGISAAVCYLLAFFAIKTYLYVEQGLYLYGSSWFYGAISIFGVVLIYFIIPETENCSLEDIENHFADNSLGFVDRTIKRRKKDSAALGQ